MSVQLRNDQNRPSAAGMKNLPAGWFIKPLGEVVTRIIGGGTPSRDNPAYWKGNIPWLTVKDMRTTRPSDAIDHISKNAVVESSTNIIPADTVIIATRVGLGKVIRVPYAAAINQDLKALIVPSNIEKAFLEYWFLSIASYLESIGSGTTVKGIRLDQLKALEMPVPSNKEQRRIVAEIEKQFSRLEEGVSALKRVQANLKRYRATVLKSAYEGKLVENEVKSQKLKGKSVGPGEQLLKRILDERRKNWIGRGKYKEPLPIEPGPLPYIPKGWAVASADAICKSVRDGTHDTPIYVDTGVPLVTSKNLLSCGLDFFNTKLISREDHIEISKRSGVERGDILFAMIGTIGNPVVVETDKEFSIKNIGLFKANQKFILSRYLRYWFMSPQFNQWLESKQKGTTQKFVPLGLLRAFVVALPPLAEQTRIVEEVERRLSVVEELESLVTTNLQRGTRLRQSILQKAFEGKLMS
jgi:type I restriction enzyme S subunit